MRVLLALGGNAMTAVDGSATPEAQQTAVAGAMESVVIDVAASDALRESLPSRRSGQEPFFDRGPGYAELSGGATSASVDWL